MTVVQMYKRWNVLGVWIAVMAGLQFASSSSALSELAGPKLSAWLAFLVGCLNAATAAYMLGTRPGPPPYLLDPRRGSHARQPGVRYGGADVRPTPVDPLSRAPDREADV